MPDRTSKSPASTRTVTASFGEQRDLGWYADHVDGLEWRGERDFICRCPSHDDGRPSLHVWEDERGLRVHCFAGCSWSDIDAALDGASVRPAAPKIIRRRERGEIVARYEYRNAEGEIVYRKLRYEPKSFGFARPVVVPARTDGPVTYAEHVAWRQGLKDSDGNYVVEPIPYRLPELLAADEVWLVDGEKDADRLSALGIVATCSPYGMARWRDKWSELLADKDVVVVADRDEPGYVAADRVRRSVCEFASSLHVVEATYGKDISDHLNSGRSLAQLREVV